MGFRAGEGGAIFCMSQGGEPFFSPCDVVFNNANHVINATSLRVLVKPFHIAIELFAIIYSTSTDDESKYIIALFLLSGGGTDV